MSKPGESPAPRLETPPSRPASEAALDASKKKARQTSQIALGNAETQHAQALTTSPEEKAGALHSSYDQKITKLAESTETKDPETDRRTLRGSEITEIRTNSRLLKIKKGEEKPEEQITNLKEETARRMRAYAPESANGWHTLNYQQMGADNKGRSHEVFVGLGDILLDPDITTILIPQNGMNRKATRGVYHGRNAFLYDDGSYAATHSGDKFRILDTTETKPEDKTPEGKKAAEKYIEKLNTDEKIRGEQKEYFKQNPDFGRFTPGQETGKYDGVIEPTGSVVDQMHGLSGSQKAAARVIEEEFRKALTGKLEPQALCNLIAGAIANALRESGLNPKIGGDEGSSVGLFQLHSGGGAKRLEAQYGADWKRYAQDPHINTREMLETEVLGKFGERLLSRAAAGASAAELAGIFAYDLERPRDKAGAAHRSAEKVLAHFGKEKPADTMENGTMVAQNAPGENTPGRVDFEKKITGKDKNGRPTISTKWMAHVKSGQEQWLIGSSIGVGLYRHTNPETTGTIATGGDGAVAMLRDLKNLYWPAIEKSGVAVPKEVTLVGLQLNGLKNNKVSNPNLSPAENARREFANYQKIAAFLKSKGIERVKISTTHVWDEIAPEILAFNDLVRTQSPDGYTDITSVAKSTNLHNSTDYPAMARLYESSTGSASA